MLFLTTNIWPRAGCEHFSQSGSREAGAATQIELQQLRVLGQRAEREKEMISHWAENTCMLFYLFIYLVASCKGTGLQHTKSELRRHSVNCVGILWNKCVGGSEHCRGSFSRIIFMAATSACSRVCMREEGQTHETESKFLWQHWVLKLWQAHRTD